MIFQIRGEYIELASLLKAAGLVASGGEGKAAVADGLVTVDGEIEARKRRKVRPGMVVVFRGETIEVAAG